MAGTPPLSVTPPLHLVPPPLRSILKDFNACQVQGCRCRQEPRSSQFSDVLHVHNWSVSYAPDPQNVRWYVHKLRPPHTTPNKQTPSDQLMLFAGLFLQGASVAGWDLLVDPLLHHQLHPLPPALLPHHTCHHHLHNGQVQRHQTRRVSKRKNPQAAVLQVWAGCPQNHWLRGSAHTDAFNFKSKSSLSTVTHVKTRHMTIHVHWSCDVNRK